MKPMFIALISFVGPLLSVAEAATQAEVVNTSQLKTAVLTGRAGLDLIRNCRPLERTINQWDPTAQDLLKLETRLAPDLNDALQRMGVKADASEYYRQYAGGSLDGDHVVYISAFHRSVLDESIADSPDSPWRHRLIEPTWGRTQFWCAYWIKETNSLVQVMNLDGMVAYVFFRGLGWPFLR